MTLRLTTPRLTIEPLANRDVPDFVAHRQDPEVARYQGWARTTPARCRTGVCGSAAQRSTRSTRCPSARW
jgi:hypothetical protein